MSVGVEAVNLTHSKYKVLVDNDVDGWRPGMARV